MAGLLVSVRSPSEALAALAGGAGIIDVKEPGRGPLGRADSGIIQEVFQAVKGKKPISAALGELAVEGQGPREGRPLPPGLSYFKWGLAGCAKFPNWREQLSRSIEECKRVNGSSQTVVVAYADWSAAGAPSVEDVFAFARGRGVINILLDTFQKELDTRLGRRPTLLDFLPLEKVSEWCHRCRETGIAMALAGSLQAEQILILKSARPDWFAVRRAVCDGEDRTGKVREERVRFIEQIVSSP